jgi:RNA 2',3'-cyclic 3'-phosphodiesterase
MRIFVALDIEDGIRDDIARFLDGIRGFAPEAHWVRPESLHVTLKFIGEKPEQEIDRIKSSLSAIEANLFEINIRGHGFFPNPRAPRLFWIGIETDSRLRSLAATVDEKLALLDVPEEEHAFNPHLTLARARGKSGSPIWRKGDIPNRSFQRLQETLASHSIPEFGRMTVREFFLYQSQLSPRGSKYTKLVAFALR